MLSVSGVIRRNVLLFQVHLQTQQSGKVGLLRMGVTVVKTDGILGLYNGLSASILRQVRLHAGSVSPVCVTQGFMQEQIIASDTCFGGHVDVNC